MGNMDSVGFIVKSLSNLFKRQILQTNFELTGMQGWIIAYLYENGRNKNIYQKDIETFFKIRRSTVTGILKLMEKNGLLTRESVPSDARLKKLILTDKAVKTYERFKICAKETDELATKGISKEKLAEFYETANQMIDNLSCKNHNKI